MAIICQDFLYKPRCDSASHSVRGHTASASEDNRNGNGSSRVRMQAGDYLQQSFVFQNFPVLFPNCDIKYITKVTDYRHKVEMKNFAYIVLVVITVTISLLVYFFVFRLLMRYPVQISVSWLKSFRFPSVLPVEYEDSAFRAHYLSISFI
jgi:hypothetical protein